MSRDQRGVSRRGAAALAGVLLLVFLSQAPRAESGWTTQIASLAIEREAADWVSELRARGIDAYWIRSGVPGVGVRYRVRVGRFATTAEARSNGERLQSLGIAEDFFVAKYEARGGALIADQSRQTGDAATSREVPPPDTRAAAVPAETPVAEEVPGAREAVFATFEDKTVGYSFRYPSGWTGAAWTDEKRLAQVGGGASFRSLEERAFLNVIWNELPGADDPGEYDNAALVDAIVKSMEAGPDVAELSSGPRTVESDAGQIKTYVDLSARFRDWGDSTTERFSGKAVISRCPRGILLVVVFYSQDAPPIAAANADRIIRSVRAPGRR